MARFFREKGYILRFIEYMDVGHTNGWRMDDVVPAAEIIKRISAEMPLEPVDPELHRRSGRTLALQGWQRRDRRDRLGHAGLLPAPATAPGSRRRASFTPACSRSRDMTSASLLRSGASDEEISQAIARVWGKRTTAIPSCAPRTRSPCPRWKCRTSGGKASFRQAMSLNVKYGRHQLIGREDVEMAESQQDMWSEWLLNRRFGGDPERMKKGCSASCIQSGTKF